MTVSPTADRTATAVLAVVVGSVLLTGCSGDTDEAPPPNDSSEAPVGPGDGAPGAVRGDLRAEVEVEDGGALAVSWTWTNLSDEPVLLADAAPGPTGTLSPTSAYVVGLADDGVVQVSQRVFDRPSDDTADYSEPFRVGVRRVGAGDGVLGEVTVAPGLEESKPYPDGYADGEAAVPSDPGSVVFCLGAVPASTPTDQDDGVLTVAHDDASEQTLFCSEPVDVG